jgi:hypothetical protein
VSPGACVPAAREVRVSVRSHSSYHPVPVLRRDSAVSDAVPDASVRLQKNPGAGSLDQGRPSCCIADGEVGVEVQSANWRLLQTAVSHLELRLYKTVAVEKAVQADACLVQAAVWAGAAVVWASDCCRCSTPGLSLNPFQE